MKKHALTAAIAAALILAAQNIALRSKLRTTRSNAAVLVTTMTELHAVDMAEIALREMIEDGLFEDKSVADMHQTFEELRQLYRIK